MGAVGQFCARTLLLEAGRAVQFGITQDVINEYLSRFLSKSEGAAQLPPDESMDMQITHILINASDGKPRAVFAPDEEVYISIQGESRRPQRNFHIWLTLRRNGVDVLNTYDSDDYPELLDRRKTGSFSYRVRLPGGLVKSGRYTANLGVGVFGVRAIQQLPDVISFSIEEPGAGSQYLGYGPNRPGVLGKVMEWSRDDS